MPARIGLVCAQGLVWFGAIAYITASSPPPVQEGLSRLQGGLTAKTIPLGETNYSSLDVLILAAQLAILIFIASNTKRLLRLRILSLTGLDRSAQESIALVMNYALIFVGVLVLMQLWGFNNSSLTVFAGVVGVAVGFGLQGITKELVSGVVLIFERPVRVGDYVEIGDVAGTVEYINLRSTEILTVDRISVILPNSQVLEAAVTNWNHTNAVSRLHVPVGAAYGSSLTRVRGALLQAAREHPDVLEMPPPSVLFKGFGENALLFHLLVWIAEPRKQFRIKSDLYFRIDELFRARRVEVPFPQRDLHVRSGALPIELTPQLTATLSELTRGITDLLQESAQNGSQPSQSPPES